MRAARRRADRVKRAITFFSSFRTKQTDRKKKKTSLLRSQKSMIEFTDLLHLLLPFLIVIEPALHHLALLRPDTELPVPASRISDRQNPHPVSFAGFATRTTLLVEDRAFQQRPAQDLLGTWQAGHDLAAFLDNVFLLHLYQ